MQDSSTLMLTKFFRILQPILQTMVKFSSIYKYIHIHVVVTYVSLFLLMPSGFRVSNAGCCGVGRNRGQITCLPFQTPCQNRNEYVFWDAFHPSEAANIIIARRSYNAETPDDAYPIDIRRLAQL